MAETKHDVVAQLFDPSTSFTATEEPPSAAASSSPSSSPSATALIAASSGDDAPRLSSSAKKRRRLQSTPRSLVALIRDGDVVLPWLREACDDKARADAVSLLREVAKYFKDRVLAHGGAGRKSASLLLASSTDAAVFVTHLESLRLLLNARPNLLRPTFTALFFRSASHVLAHCARPGAALHVLCALVAFVERCRSS